MSILHSSSMTVVSYNVTTLVIFICLLSNFLYSKQIRTQVIKQHLYPKFSLLATKSRNDSRKIHVSNTINETRGVYYNKTKSLLLNLQNTVFISVAAFNQKSIAHYKVYFRNFLCFVNHYDIKMILYVLHHEIDDFDSEIQNFAALGVSVLTYPDELFWTLVAKKKTAIKAGKGYADYAAEIPSFASFGALVMLVPVLEVLEHNCNVIFFDVDIGLVQDPVPYLVKGDADFVSSLEIRTCPEFFTASRPDETAWETLEPNTGVMHVRATPQGRKLFREWLERIVDANLMNDQRAFDRKALKAVHTRNCNRLVGNASRRLTTEEQHPFRAPTYCFLSEVLFQNGMVAVQCPIKPGLRDDWVLGMHRHGTPGFSSVTNESLGARYPVAIHANYCKGKSHELKVRGLWLLLEQDNVTSCSAYKMTETYYASAMNWSAEVLAVAARRDAQFQEHFHNGSLVQRMGGQEVFLIDVAGHRRQVPDKDTFERLFGENWSIVKVVSTEVLERASLGEPLTSLKPIPT